MKKTIGTLLILLIILGCGGYPTGYTPEPEYDITEIVTSGWTDFTSDSLEQAIVHFNKAIKLDTGNVAAHVGKGWSLLMQTESSKDSSLFFLQKGIEDSVWNLDASCGFAVAKFILSEFQDALSSINTVLTEAPAYYFQYKTSINWQDLLVIQAQIQYLNRDYIEALASVEKLTREFNLDPDASATWVVEGIEYLTFEAALSKAIAILSERYA